MTAQPIRLHASTHLPQGSDPLIAVPFALYRGSRTVTSPTADADNPIDMTEFITNDPSVYALVQGTGGFSSYHGPGVLIGGVYRVSYSMYITNATNNDIIGSSTRANGFGVTAVWLEGWTSIKFDAAPNVYDVRDLENKIRFWGLRFVDGELWTNPATYPVSEIVTIYSDGGFTFSADVSIFVEQLGGVNYQSNIPAGSTP